MKAKMKTKTKKILTIVLLLAIASSVTIFALVTMQSPVRQAIMQSELDDLIAASGGTRLTTNPGPDNNPVWSPDGTKIFFKTRPDIGSGHYSSKCYIAVMNADGSGVTRLANGTNPVVRSGKVYFEYYDPVYTDLLVTEVMDLDGGNREKLLSLNVRTYPHQVMSPDRTKVCYCTRYKTDSYFVWWRNDTVTKEKGDWNLDGGKYEDAWQSGEICMAGQETHSDIWVMNLDESNKIKIASGLESINRPPQPRWSPDGKKILFLNPAISPETHIENIDIWVMDVNGGNKMRLTDHPGCDVDPRWSHDMKKIVYQSKNQDNFDIWIMNPNGSGKEQLTESPDNEADLEWSFDGLRAAYISWSSDGYLYEMEHDYEDKSEIWVMNIGGSGKERLLSIPHPYGVICGIEWSPDGSKMVFEFHPNYGNDDIYVIDVPAMGAR
jgi:Tol biopolymer transport system component